MKEHEYQNNKINQWTKTTCPYCGVGCGVEARVNNLGKVEVRGDKNHPANFGRLCSKGMALGETVVSQGRLQSPVVGGHTSNWDHALDTVAQGFLDTIEKHGPESVAFYCSAQLLTEDYYVANKLMKGFIGSGNIDTNSRLCMSSTVAGHKRAFGSDTVPNCYADLECADLVVITGSNLAWCHPVLYQRIKAAKQQRPRLKVVVIDPRTTDTCEIADLHLPINPGTDVALFNGLLCYLDKGQYLDQHYIASYTEGFEGALSMAKSSTPAGEALAEYLGVDMESLELFFHWFAEHERVVTAYSQGINQSSQGTDKVNSILNCHLAAGRIGREGCGPFSLTGQPNAMGGREVGGLANTLAAHMEYGNVRHAELIGEYWKTDNLAKQPGLKALDLFDAVAEGKVKAIWIMATNPVVSLPNSDKVAAALSACPLVVVSDCIANTDTTALADVLLPARGWVEKSGMVTNSERRMSRQRSLIAGTSNAKPDWWILTQVARRMGFSHEFDYQHESEIFNEYAAMTALGTGPDDQPRDLNLSGLNLSPEEYEALTPQQWPIASAPSSSGGHENKRFFAQGGFYTPSQRAQFVPLRPQAPGQSTSEHFPLILNTGRIRDQWHTMTRTGLSSRLSTHLSEPYVSVNPVDIERFQLEDGGIADISNQWGTMRARVVQSTKVKPGQLFIPIHWTDQNSSAGRVNRVVSPDRDAISGQPESKYTPTSIKAWNYGSEAMLLVTEQLSPTQLRQQICDYWVEQKINGGYLYYLADARNPENLAEVLLTLCPQSQEHQVLEYSQASGGHYRRSLAKDNLLVSCFVLAPKLVGADYTWLETVLGQRVSAEIQRALYRGTACDQLARGKVVCACKQVGEQIIYKAIRDQSCHTTEAITHNTSAGSGCGTCVSQLQQILDEGLAYQV